MKGTKTLAHRKLIGIISSCYIQNVAVGSNIFHTFVDILERCMAESSGYLGTGVCTGQGRRWVPGLAWNVLGRNVYSWSWSTRQYTFRSLGNQKERRGMF